MIFLLYTAFSQVFLDLLSKITLDASNPSWLIRGATNSASLRLWSKRFPEPPVKTKPTKMTKARLNALTKVQLEEKGRELGIEVDKRVLKSKIVNEVYKAQ